MKKMFGLIAAAAVIGLSGCGGDAPDAVALKFMEASSEGNIEKVCSYASKDTAKGIQGMIEVDGKDMLREQMMEYKDVSF